MTNPVILLGTQSNGETLPVQVDATGRLVAEGLQGPQGEQGEEGIQGPPGPPGEPAWPPNPQENQVITYKNGEVVWADSSGGSSVPTSFRPFLHNLNGYIQDPYKAFEPDGCDSARTGPSGGYWGLYPPVDMLILTFEIMAGKRAQTIEYRLGDEIAWLGTIGYPSCDEVGVDNAWVYLNRLSGLEWKMDTPVCYQTQGGTSQSFFKRVRVNGLDWVNGGLQYIKHYESIRWNLFKSGVSPKDLIDNERLFGITSTSAF